MKKFWIVRDNTGLWLHENYPYLIKTHMGDEIFTSNGNAYKIDSDLLYKEVTFETSPQKIEIEIKLNQ